VIHIYEVRQPSSSLIQLSHT